MPHSHSANHQIKILTVLKNPEKISRTSGRFLCIFLIKQLNQRIEQIALTPLNATINLILFTAQ